MIGCPNDETLSALVRRALDAAEAAAVTSHLDECGACRGVIVAVVRSKTPIAMGTPSDGVPGLPLVPGQRVGRYVVRNLLGAGGMGHVYEAYDRELDRAIALKILHPKLASSAVVLAERLVRESRLMAKVVHPAVITVHDVGREGAAVFIAMELIRGETLAMYVARVRPTWREIVALYEGAGAGLAAAHRAGVVHRDFKPDNVLIETSTRRVVVTDFGIARATTTEVDAPTTVTLTSPGGVVGTPAYMAPEQLRGGNVDARADVFAFSVSLWESLFGARPFGGTTVAEIRAALATRPRSPGGVPRGLVAILERGLALERDDRWPDVDAMIAALAGLRSHRRRIQLAAGAVAFVALGVTGALVMARPSAAPACTGEALEDAYEARRARLPIEVQALLDPVAASWRDTQRATCGKPVHTACLDARLLELRSYVDDVLADGPSHAIALARTIGDPAACRAPAPSLVNANVPDDPALRRRVTQIRYRLFDAQAARSRADYPTALATLPAIVTDAAVWPRVHGEALYEAGGAQMETGNVKAAIASLRQAAAIAQHSLHDSLAASSWIDLTAIATFDEGDTARGLEYMTYAEAAAERCGRPPRLEAVLQYVKGTTLIEANRVEEAEVALRRALVIAETTVPATLGQALQGLGFLYERQGRYADSVATYRRAIASLESGMPENEVVYRTRLANNLGLLGKHDEAEGEAKRASALADQVFPIEHTDRAIAHQTLAQVLRTAGKHEAALAVAQAASKELAKSQGPRSLRYAQALTLEGEILDDLGRYAQAVKTIARSCDIIAFEGGEDSASLAQCWMSQTSALTGLRRNTEALALIERAVPVMVASYGADHPLVASALIMRATVHTGLSHRALAIADLQRAVAILEATPFDPTLLADAQRALAKLQ